MWQLQNNTPFAAERAWVRDRDGAEVWLVVVKCTFGVLPDGSSSIAAEQPEVLRLPLHYGEASSSSIKYDADLVLTKTTTDILLLGKAHAPGSRPVSELQVEMGVGPINKQLHVCGARTWSSGAASSPEPFVSMPLDYERAFGGVDQGSGAPQRQWDTRNPVGVGFATESGHLEGRPLPSIEYGNNRFNTWSDRPEPAGYGPLCSHWSSRARYAGTYDHTWMEERQPLLPMDFDERFFQSAPADQQADQFLEGGEMVRLKNLTPSGFLQFVLPRVSLHFETLFSNGERAVHERRKLHTVIIEPEFPRLSLVWHTSLPCHGKVQKLKGTVVSVRSVV